jgi:hypothetical protein
MMYFSLCTRILCLDSCSRFRNERRSGTDKSYSPVKQPTLRRPATLFSGGRDARIPFSFSLFRGDGAPGGARELARLPSPACEAGVSRQDSGTQSFPRGWGSRGARAFLRKGPAPPQVGFTRLASPQGRPISGKPEIGRAPSSARCWRTRPAPPSNAAIDGALD